MESLQYLKNKQMINDDNIWDNRIKLLKPHADKIESFLKSKGISVEPGTERMRDGRLLHNMILSNDTKSIKIAKHCYYRGSGIARIMKCTGVDKKGEKIYDYIPVTDEMYFSSYLKTIILHRFLEDNK